MASSAGFTDPPTASERPSGALRLRRWRGWWALLAVLVSAIPVVPGFSSSRVFHVRDLCLVFWGRFVWFRRSLLSGEWPLWDPYLGGGQSAVADALHQMFLPPVVALRLIGSEVVAFNLWVALPFPIAAFGTFLFLRRRFSPEAAALGAVAFAVSGPVASTGSFPNLSWSVAAMPWVFWAADRVMVVGGTRTVAALAGVFGLQALAGEPVTMTATGATVVAYAVWVGARQESSFGPRRAWRTGGVAAGVALGLAVAAIQLMPLAAAVRDSWRPLGISKDFWSLHPLAIGELLSPHLFGDYFEVNSFTQLPWMAPLNSGRDPFFYSIYLGPALVSVAVFGALAGWRRAWSGFWATAGALALFLAFGPHTPVYPFVRDHVPLVGSFRYPVKYLLVLSIALSALVAAGWDALAGDERRVAAARRFHWARMSAVALAVVIAAVAYGLAGACVYLPAMAGDALATLAAYVGVWDPADGAAYLLRTLPNAASRLMLFSLAAALFVAVAATRRREARLARTTLYALMVVELTVAAWGLNPTFDARHFREPGWVSAMKGDSNARCYFGGKVNGTVTMLDIDGPRSFIRPFDLDPAEGRDALAAQLAFYPGGWRIREMLSYDLASLWPRPSEIAAARFRQSDREARDRFLFRTGVRYRMLPMSLGGDRPSTEVKYLTGMRFYDWGPVFPRVNIVADAIVVADVREQITLLFSPSFDPAKTVALTSAAGDAWGRPGTPATPAARLVGEGANRVTIEAGAPASGAYLLLVDSYSPDWHVTVDGVSATLQRANALFRAVRLAPGLHTVEFRYLPQSFVIGATVSASAIVLCILLAVVNRRRRPSALSINSVD